MGSPRCVRSESECVHGFPVMFCVTDCNERAVLERGAGQGLDIALPIAPTTGVVELWQFNACLASSACSGPAFLTCGIS
jgi:hypothetical protein